MAISEQISRLDVSLFGRIETQTTDEDKRSLLALHTAVADAVGSFAYLEIGSYLGGSLQAMVADPRCRRIVSVDPRPVLPPDDRPEAVFEYPDNSTERMLALLRHVPGADMGKVQTIESSTEDIPPGSIARPDFCFVDGEHTRAAALRDGRFCRAVMQGAGLLAFHDFSIVEPGIAAFLRETPGPLTAYLLRTSVFVVELGEAPSVIHHPAVIPQINGPARTWRLLSRLGLASKLLDGHQRYRRLFPRTRSHSAGRDERDAAERRGRARELEGR